MKAALIPLLGLLCFTSVLATQPDSTSHVDKLIEGVTVQGKSMERQLRSLGLPIYDRFKVQPPAWRIS